MLTGKYPLAREDNSPFDTSVHKGDKRRAELAGQNLSFRGAVVQCRGDWAWFKHSLCLVGWSGEGEEKRTCFKCKAGYKSVPFTDFSTSAKWRSTCVNQALCQICYNRNPAPNKAIPQTNTSFQKDNIQKHKIIYKINFTNS